MPDPDPDAASDLQRRLETQATFVSSAGAPVVSLIARVPNDRDSKGYATFFARRGAIVPRFDPVLRPRDALKSPGNYLAVETRDDHLVHVVRLGGPPFLVAEKNAGGTILSDIQPVGETMRSHVQPAGPTVISTTVPFAPGGRIEVFEVDGTGTVRSVALTLELESDPDMMPRVRLWRREP